VATGQPEGLLQVSLGLLIAALTVVQLTHVGEVDHFVTVVTGFGDMPVCLIQNSLGLRIITFLNVHISQR